MGLRRVWRAGKPPQIEADCPVQNPLVVHSPVDRRGAIRGFVFDLTASIGLSLILWAVQGPEGLGVTVEAYHASREPLRHVPPSPS
jgi:hypothetical protein